MSDLIEDDIDLQSPDYVDKYAKVLLEITDFGDREKLDLDLQKEGKSLEGFCNQVATDFFHFLYLGKDRSRPSPDAIEHAVVELFNAAINHYLEIPFLDPNYVSCDVENALRFQIPQMIETLCLTKIKGYWDISEESRNNAKNLYVKNLQQNVLPSLILQESHIKFRRLKDGYPETLAMMKIEIPALDLFFYFYIES